MAHQFSSPAEAARVLSEAAISFVPVKTDGSKAASVEWKPYQERLPTASEVAAWFGNGVTRGIATICGDVSGGLEAVDLDAPDLREEFESLVRESCPGLLEKLLIVQTPKDGRHYIFRSAATEKNQKLARRKIDDQIRVTIETRGEGGYVVAPGSPAKCHPLNKPYVITQGDYLSIPRISREDRTCLLDCARSFNEIMEEVRHHTSASHSPAGVDKPGADFNSQANVSTVEEMLKNAGWTRLNRRSKYGQMWKRPGKTDPGASATLCDNGALHVFSVNAHPFEDGKSYSPFAVLTLTQFNGDFGKCAKALAEQGYGEQLKPKPQQPTRRRPAENPSAPEPKPDRLFSASETLLRPKEMSFHGMAARFHAKFYKTTRYVEARGVFFNYCGGVWKQSRCEAEIKTQIIINDIHEEHATLEQQFEALKTRQSAGDQTALEQMAKIGPYKAALQQFLPKIKKTTAMTQTLEFARSSLLIEADAFDPDHSILNLANGTIDLTIAAFHHHRPADLCSMQSPVSYAKDSQCPRWERFLKEIFLDDLDLIAFMQRAIGYSISGHTSEQVFLILHGDGSNGKSELLTVLEKLLGGYLKSANVDTFMDDRPVTGGHNEDIARLRGARLVTTTETEKSKRLAEGLIKRLTGEDTIMASFKHERSFEFKPRFKVWLAANHKPQITGTDHGMWRRILLIPFQAKFIKAGCDLGRNQFHIDKALRATLEAELPGILNWAIHGFQEWRAQGLNPPEVVKAASEEYRIESDKLGAFLAEEMIEGDDYKCVLADAYTAYKKWSEDGGMKYPSIRGFSSDLKSRGVEIKKYGLKKTTMMFGYALPAGE